MNIHHLIALSPILVTTLTVIVVMLSIAFRRNHWLNATLTVLGLNAALVAVVYVVYASPALDITPLLVLDPFSAFYMALILMITLACATMAHAYLEAPQSKGVQEKGYQGNREEIYLLLVLSALGGLVLVSSRHLASFFIGLELLSIPVYGMIAYTFRNARSLEAGIKYIVLSATASAILLFGMALIYAVSGTLSFRGLAQVYLSAELMNPMLLIGSAMVLSGVAFKLSVAPFHAWTADVYEGAPAPISAYLSTAGKAAVLAVLIRFLYESGAVHSILVQEVLGILAGISIVVGNLLAIQQNNIKRLLAYSSIAHFGYLLIPLSAHLGTPEAVTMYLVTYIVMTLAAFGVVSLMSSPYKGQDADQLHNYRGLFWRRPYLTAVMTVMMLSLAGIPVTAGFIGKFYVAAAGVAAHLWWLLALLVIGSAIGLYYYLRVMIIMFLPQPSMHRYDAPLNWGVGASGLMVLGLTVLMFLIGLYPQPIITLIEWARPAIMN